MRPHSLPTLFVILAASAAVADAPKVTVENAVVKTAHVVTQASSGGTSALDQIDAARAAITGGDYAKATQDLTAAQSQLAELRKLNPAAPVQDGIRSAQAKLAGGDVDGAASDLEAMSSSLTVIDDYEAALAHVKIETEKPKHVTGSVGKAHIQKALGHLKVKDIEHATVALQAAYETTVYTEVDLPVAASYYEVTHALEALQDGAKNGYDKGYSKIADDQLAAAEASAKTIVAVATSKDVDTDVAAGPE